MAKLLLFDLDGTLVRTGGAGLRAITELFRKRYGLDNAINGYDGRGKTDPVIFADIIREKLKRVPRPGEIKRLVDIYPRFLKPHVRRSPGYRLVGDIKRFLGQVSKLQGIYLALGTGNIEKGARLKLERARLNRYFPVGGFATDSPLRPVLLRKGVAKARRYYKRRFHKTDVFVIGDTVRDVHAARVCGYRSVVIAGGFGKPDELKASNPEFYFEDYSNIEDWIEKLGLLVGGCST